MAKIPEYRSLKEKREFFENEEFFIIDTKSELDRWFQFYSSNFKKEHPVDFIFRGMTEAKYKLFTSAQRIWISDEMKDWKINHTYKGFIESIVNKAKAHPLIKRIFELYNYNEHERDFPILSLLQHYGAPTPIIDWSYNINIAAFFAIDGVKRERANKGSIENYISIYSIHKKNLHRRRELLSIFDISNGSFPSISSLREFGDERNNNSNSLFILSDFETRTDENYDGPLRVKTEKPVTSLYNQNIIPQEGLLMYNPFQDRPLESLFNVRSPSVGQNLQLEPFKCFNINKDLTEYLRRLISVKYGIDKSFIYPYLYDDSKKIKETVLNSILSP